MFNVIENVAGSITQASRAAHIFAFIGGNAYIVKSRNIVDTNPNIPQKPDRVIGVYYNNTTETCDIQDILMRPI